MRPNEKEEINSRFDQIECLLRELKEESSKRYVEIDQKLNDVIESQKFLSKQYENFRNTIDNLINDNVKMREQLDKLRQQVGEAEKKVKTALDEVNNLEQYGRRDMIEIGGIPRTSDESVEDIVVHLFDKLQLRLTKTDIEAAHRISTRERASIIVKFASRRTRDAAYSKRNLLKTVQTHDFGIATERDSSKIYLNESLSRSNKALFSQALGFKKTHNVKFLWTRNGNIYMRLSETAKKVVQIKCADDLSLEKLTRDH